MDTKDEFKGKYMNVDSTKDGQIATMVSGGTIEEITFGGKTKKVRNIPVKIGDTELIFSPWDKDGRALQAAFGFDSDNWAGKKLQILHVEKKMVVRPIVEEKVK